MSDELHQRRLDEGQSPDPADIDSIAYWRVMEAARASSAVLPSGFAGRVTARVASLRARSTAMSLLMATMAGLLALVTGLGSVRLLALAGYPEAPAALSLLPLTQIPPVWGYGVLAMFVLAAVDELLGTRKRAL